MKCPNCNRTMRQGSAMCPLCGHAMPEDVRRYGEYLADMKDDLSHLASMKQTLRKEISHIEQRVQKYEKLIADASRKEASTLTTEMEALELAEIFAEDTSSQPEPQPELRPKPAPEMKKKIPTPAPQKRQKDPGAGLSEVNFGQKWLLVIGIVTMILGVGYFLKYSIEQGWIGPAGRVALTYAWGSAFVGAGAFIRMRGHARYGLSLIGTGAVTLYFGTFAAYHMYGLFPLTLSYVLMAGVTLGLCVLSVRFSAFWLAVMGMLGGFGTPFMLGLGEGQSFILGYAAVLNAGLLFIAYRRRWPALEWMGMIFTYALFGMWYAEHYRWFSFAPVVAYTAFFALMYHVVPFATAYLGNGNRGGRFHAPMLALVNTGLSLLLCVPLFERHVDNLHWFGLPLILHAASLASMGLYLHLKRPEEKGALVALFAGAGVLSAVAVPVTLGGYWLTLGWVLLALVLLTGGQRLGRAELSVGAYILFALAAGRFMLHDYSAIFGLDTNRMFFTEGYAAHLLARWTSGAGVLVPILAGALFASRTKRKGGPVIRDGHSVLYGLFGVTLFALMNIEVAGFFFDYMPSARFAAISVLWTAFSVGLMSIGFVRNITALRHTSLALFAITIAKVFFVDMAEVGTPWRILSFIVLGTVLIGTSYLYHRHKDRIIEALGESRENAAQGMAR